MDYDVIIIGSGPSGLTSALYTSRARLRTLVIESELVPAQAIITDCIENYPGFPDGISGFELIGKFRKQVERFRVEFKSRDVQKVSEYLSQGMKGWKVEFDDECYTSSALIIAVGAKPKKLGVLGEDRLMGKGISYCATCDGPLYKDKTLVVIGGGDSAIEEALFLTRFSKKVILVHRRDSLRATKILQERAYANKKIELVLGAIVVDVLGEDKVRGVRIRDIKTQQEKDIFCEGVFVFVGYVPNTDFIRGIVSLDNNGYILTDENMKTSIEGIFACGDCRKKILRQIVTACGDGAIAGFSVQQYIEEIKREISPNPSFSKRGING